MVIINRIGKYNTKTWEIRNSLEVERITIHHTGLTVQGTDEEVLKYIQKNHEEENGWPGISYHFVILKNGNVYQVNNISDLTFHDSINKDSLAIALHGNFHKEENPTFEQLKSFRELLDDLCLNHPEFPANRDDIFLHSERTNTCCPGDNISYYIKDYRIKKGDVSWGANDTEKFHTHSSAQNWDRLLSFLGLSSGASYDTVKGKLEFTSSKVGTLERQIEELEDSLIKEERVEKVLEKNVSKKVKDMGVVEFLRRLFE